MSLKIKNLIKFKITHDYKSRHRNCYQIRFHYLLLFQIGSNNWDFKHIFFKLILIDNWDFKHILANWKLSENDHLTEFHLTFSVDRKFLIIWAFDRIFFWRLIESFNNESFIFYHLTKFFETFQLIETFSINLN